MKKALIFLFAATVAVTSCRKDEPEDNTIKEVADLATQNANDDKAIEKYMGEHYLDANGKIKAFSSTDASDDGYKKLSQLNHNKLASGVIVIQREGAQPEPGTAIGDTDVIRLMHKTTTFLSTSENNAVNYTSEFFFGNTVEGSGLPQVDPAFYSASKTLLDNSKKPASYYEIEGFKEGLKTFKSYNIPDSDNYNLQGVIIVPSRAAFARDEHYAYNNINWRNRNFIFNFQVYKSTPRQ